MLKRTDIVDKQMLDDLKVIAEFQCGKWECKNCPFNTKIGSGCISRDIYELVERYERGEEVIY